MRLCASLIFACLLVGCSTPERKTITAPAPIPMELPAR